MFRTRYRSSIIDTVFSRGRISSEFSYGEKWHRSLMEFIEHNALGDQLPLDEETDGRRWDCGPATFGPDCAQNAQRELLPRTLTKRRVATITASAGKRPCPLRTSCGGAGIFRHRAQDGRGAFFAKHPPPPQQVCWLGTGSFHTIFLFIHWLHAAYIDCGEIPTPFPINCPRAARCSASLAFRPGLSRRDNKRTKENA